MSKIIIRGQEARNKLLSGVAELAETVTITLGPKGHNVGVDRRWGTPLVLHDGVSIAKEIDLSDPFQNMGAQLVKEASMKTADHAGDGPQPLYAKVLTPTGWKKMGEIQAGDRVCGVNGTIQTVRGIWLKGKKEVYKVTLAGNRTIECSGEHLWTVVTYKGVTKTITTEEMSKRVSIGKNNLHKYYIPNTIVNFEEEELSLDPYFLGILLGDGSLSQGDSTEICIGKNKKHIIKKIRPPEGLTLNVSFVEKRNCYRIKICGKTVGGKTIRNFLEELKLLGTRSDTKFIPRNYLFSSIETRKKLLQGLSDTDGYINKRGLMEYSTISNQLALDVAELLRGLGKSIGYKFHKRTNDKNSYSNTPIHRITELVGGRKTQAIIKIERTGKLEEMKCFKVSNSDGLYITNNYVTTHNTTTATLLAYELTKRGLAHLEAGANAMTLKKGIDLAVSLVVEQLDKIAKPIETKDQIASVATISSADPVIGTMIADAMEKIGKNGVISVEEGTGFTTEIEYKEGVEFDKGYFSHFFVTNTEKMVVEVETPLILFTDLKLDSPQALVEWLGSIVSEEHKNIVLIADGFENNTIPTLVANKQRGTLNVVAIEAPGFGIKRKWLLEDMAVMTGGTFISREAGGTLSSVTLKELGQAEKVWCDVDKARIIGGKGDTEAMQQRAKNIEEQKVQLTSDFEKKQIDERIAKLTGGVAIIKVGAQTEIELKEKKERIIDAVEATKSAVAEGIVAGGGVTLAHLADYLYLSETEDLTGDMEKGYRLVEAALEEPFGKIMTNAGVDPSEIWEKIQNGNTMGYNIETEKFGDMFEMGVVDPKKVTRQALENAASVASMILTCEALVSEKEETKELPSNQQ